MRRWENLKAGHVLRKHHGKVLAYFLVLLIYPAENYFFVHGEELLVVLLPYTYIVSI